MELVSNDKQTVISHTLNSNVKIVMLKLYQRHFQLRLHKMTCSARILGFSFFLFPHIFLIPLVAVLASFA